MKATCCSKGVNKAIIFSMHDQCVCGGVMQIWASINYKWFVYGVLIICIRPNLFLMHSLKTKYGMCCWFYIHPLLLKSGLFLLLSFLRVVLICSYHYWHHHDHQSTFCGLSCSLPPGKYSGWLTTIDNLHRLISAAMWRIASKKTNGGRDICLEIELSTDIV